MKKTTPKQPIFNGQKKAIFLDRDGVINQAIIKQGKPYPPASVEELEILNGVPNALAALKQAGYLLIVVTNQPDVARGKTSKETVSAIHQKLMKTLPLDDIRACLHDDQDRCHCRKPAPGLLIQAASDYNVDLKKSFMIGDRWKDIEAGQRAGCQTIWLDYSYQESAPKIAPDLIASSLKEATDWILQQNE